MHRPFTFRVASVPMPWPNTLLVFLLMSAGVLTRAASLSAAEPVALPARSDWTLRGTAFEAGADGAWDVRLHGQISPCAVIKKDGRYFLYYIGADGARSTDGGPRHRALGVASSEDGLEFARHSENPVLTHLPHENEEEGIFSAGSAVGAEGRVVIHYGAIWARNATTESVRSNVALATAADPTDPADLTDRGDVLLWDDRDVWGWGDEIFPVGTLREGDTWHVYYIAKGNEGAWKLALASGPAPDELPRTRPVLESGAHVIGGCEPVRISEDRIALFIVRDFDRNRIEVRTAPVSAPHRLSEPRLTYRFPGYRHTTVLLDREVGTWFMYQRRAGDNRIVVRTAPIRKE